MNERFSQLETAIGPRELQRRLSAGAPARLLDVRTPGEFAAGHVPGARLAPLDDLDPGAFGGGAGGEGGPLYVLCQSGGRARKAIARLEGAGVAGCVLVEGGTEAWIAAGLPVERGGGGGLPLMRQVQIVVGSVTAAGAVLALGVDRSYAIVPLVMGSGLLFAGLTGFCGLALVLAKMPWNRARACGCGGGGGCGGKS